MKGTIIDDTLESFSDYNLKNEIYAIGVILYFIFTGKQNLNFRQDDVISAIVKKCVDRDHNIRYNTVDEIITELSNLLANEKNKKDIDLKVKHGIIEELGLDGLSIELLKNAVESNRNIYYIRTLSGTTITSGKHSYIPNTPREMAELDNAIELLENNLYIKATGYKREIFKVTKKGYDCMDALATHI